MTFAPWYPLASAAQHTPARAGVLQLRVANGLLDYPSGKSAMVCYQVAGDMRAAAVRLAQRHADAGYLCRHTEQLSARETADLEAAFAALVGRFRVRFGAPPSFPS